MQEFRNHIVLIPTMDRPRQLSRTVESIFLNMQTHGRKNVRIVVFDDSKISENADENKKRLGEAARKYCKGMATGKASEEESKRFLEEHVIYYGKGEQERFLKNIAKDAKHVELFVPRSGSFGRARNFLTLAGIAHGDEKTAFHLFDDDSSLHEIPASDAFPRKTKVRPYSNDFFEIAGNATAQTGHAMGTLHGMRDVSLHVLERFAERDINRELSKIIQLLDSGKRKEADANARHLTLAIETMKKGRVPLASTATVKEGMESKGAGFNRSLSYAALKTLPFVTHGADEDVRHANMLKLHGFHVTPHEGTLLHWHGEQKNAIVPHAVDFMGQRKREPFNELTRTLEELNRDSLKGVTALVRSLKHMESIPDDRVLQPREKYTTQDSARVELATREWNETVNAAEAFKKKMSDRKKK